MSKDDIEKKLIKRVEAELDEIDMDQRYCDMIDEFYSFDSVGGPFANMQPSRVLEEVDPIAFRCGKNDWEDGELRGNGLIEVNGKVYDEDDVQAIRDELEAEADEEAEAEAEEEEQHEASKE